MNCSDEEGKALLGKNIYGADYLDGDVILRVFSAGARFSSGLASSYDLKYGMIIIYTNDETFIDQYIRQI